MSTSDQARCADCVTDFDPLPGADPDLCPACAIPTDLVGTPDPRKPQAERVEFVLNTLIYMMIEYRARAEGQDLLYAMMRAVAPDSLPAVYRRVAAVANDTTRPAYVRARAKKLATTLSERHTRWQADVADHYKRLHEERYERE